MDLTPGRSLKKQREKFWFNTEYAKHYQCIPKNEPQTIFSNCQPSGKGNKSDIYGAKCLHDIFLEICKNIDISNRMM